MKRILPVLCLLSLLLASTANAQLYFKNDAPYTVWVAIDYYVPSSKAWYSKGWYKLEAVLGSALTPEKLVNYEKNQAAFQAKNIKQTAVLLLFEIAHQYGIYQK